MLTQTIRRSTGILAHFKRNASTVQKNFDWNGQSINYEVMNGQSDNLPIVFMPAPFMTTHRNWFKPAIEKMEGSNPIVLLEPPGFGENSAVKMDASHMKPDTYISFIDAFLKHVHAEDFNQRKMGLVASGVSGCYSLEVAKENAHLFDRIMLANATFAGPFPTVKAMMAKKGKQNLIPIADVLFNIIYYLQVVPVLHKLVSYLMTTPSQIRGQINSHVFADPANVTPEFIDRMVELCRMKRSKWLQPSFMNGHLDPYKNRQQMIESMEKIDSQGVPINAVMGKKIFAPTKDSLKEFDEYEAKSKHYKTTLMAGSLWSYVEYPEEFSGILNDYFK